MMSLRQILYIILYLSSSFMFSLEEKSPNIGVQAPYLYTQFWSTKPTTKQRNLIEVFAVNSLDFTFPTPADYKDAVDSGNYVTESAIPIDVDVYYSSPNSEPTVFMTIPRFAGGIPYSLAVIDKSATSNGTKLKAYPDYSWHKTHGSDCDGLTSVYRMQIDNCGNLWVLDSGEIDYVQHCQPQIVVFDLQTDKLVKRYRMPKGMYKPGTSRFVTPLVDVIDPLPYGKCEKAIIYMADVTAFSIVVYNILEDKWWKIENKYTYPDPDFGTHTIAGESFELLDGVLGLSMTPTNIGLRRYLYFHSLSNDAQVAIPLDVINNSTIWNNDVHAALNEFILLGKRGVQCGPSAMTSNGYLLCGFLKPIALVGWNIRLPYTKSNRIILAENSKTLQFVSGIKVRKNQHNQDEVWLLSNRLQKIYNGNLNFNEINFRIQKCDFEDLLYNKPCKYY